MRYYLLDRITEYEHSKTATAIKCWTMSDPIFEQHFPGVPIVPGALQIESMAQLLGYLIYTSYIEEFDQTGIAFLSIVHKSKFHKWVRPGDKTILKAELKTLDIDRGSGKVDVFVDNELVSEAMLSFVIIKGEIAQKYIDRLLEYYDTITLDLKK